MVVMVIPCCVLRLKGECGGIISKYAVKGGYITKQEYEINIDQPF